MWVCRQIWPSRSIRIWGFVPRRVVATIRGYTILFLNWKWLLLLLDWIRFIRLTWSVSVGRFWASFRSVFFLLFIRFITVVISTPSWLLLLWHKLLFRCQLMFTTAIFQRLLTQISLGRLIFLFVFTSIWVLIPVLILWVISLGCFHRGLQGVISRLMGSLWGLRLLLCATHIALLNINFSVHI
jgi:hypothetical protein